MIDKEIRMNQEIEQIRFGDVFLFNALEGHAEHQTKAVITQLYSEGLFEAHNVIEAAKVEALHPYWAGTHKPENILQIVDNWNYERVIKTLNEGAKFAKTTSPNSRTLDCLFMESRKPAMILK